MGGIITFLPFIAILAIFYFMVIVPQRRKQQELQELISTVKLGETIVTSGGIIGKIVQMNEKSLIIRSADKSNLEIARSAVVGKEAAD
ncbi:MAG: preprotein translocase subunit YajC [Pyrinomonadaceae bacterium]